MVKITAPNGKRIKDTRTGAEYSVVVCNEKKAERFILADGEGDLSVVELDGITLADRVSDLEDAVIELASIIAEE